MRTAALASAFVACLTLGQAARARRPPVHVSVPLRGGTPAPSLAAAGPTSACPAGALPDGEVCVPVPGADDDPSGPESEPEPNAHFDRHGRWVIYDQIPRRPDRPADYDAYRYPVPCNHGCVVSGYDLDRPDDAQRRGRHLAYIGHGAVDLVQPRGTPIRNVSLEHQEGDAQVVYVGPLFGTTVIARASLREGGRLREYVILFGHLEATATGLAPGNTLKEGDLIGTVGDTGSPELVHLHLEARRVRDGVDVSKLGPAAIIGNENSVVCDPRNVLPLR